MQKYNMLRAAKRMSDSRSGTCSPPACSSLSHAAFSWENLLHNKQGTYFRHVHESANIQKRSCLAEFIIIF
jgi:hypothetical protein